MREESLKTWLASPPPSPLFIYTVTPPQVNTSTGTNNPVTLTIGVYNPKKNGAVTVKYIEFAISIGNNQNDLTDDPADVQAQANQSGWTIEKLPYISSPLIFKARPAEGVNGLAANESISFELTGINVNDVEGPAPVFIAEVTETQTALPQVNINKTAPGLEITYFNAVPSGIQPGEQSTLSWETTAASTVSIDQLNNAACPGQSFPNPLPLTGSIQVCPLEDTTYTLTAYDEGGGYVQAQATVSYLGAQIIKFWADPARIDCTNPQVTLKWEVENADSLTLFWDPGNSGGTDVTGKPSYEVTPDTYTTYTLIAGGSPPDNKTTPASVESAVIDSFTATPASFIRGQPVTLAWATEHACSCSIDQGVGSVQPASGGSTILYPQEEMTWTLTASGLGPQASSPSSAVTPEPSGWNQVTATGPTAIVGLSYGGQLWLIDTLNSIVYSSADGVNWETVTSTAPFSGIHACAAVVFDDGNGEKMWITGGANKLGTQIFNNIWCSADGVTWTEVETKNIWPARSAHACLAFQQNLWVLGGMDADNNAVNDVWSSPDGVTWTEVTNSAAWSERSYFGAAVFSPLTPSGINQMWICGGINYLNFGVFQDAWYTNDGETWVQAPTPPWSARGQCALFMLNNRLYLFGGITVPITAVMDMWIMDASMNWTQSPDPLPFYSGYSVDPPASVVYDWRIWMTQPFNLNSSNQGSTYSYTP